MGLRKDDISILQKIKEELGVGKIYTYEKTNTHLNSKPQARYTVNDIKGCLKIMEIFDRYSLKTKKKKDYEIWKNFMLLFTEPRIKKQRTEEVKERLYFLSNKLKLVRIYA